jgi:DNA-binding transcriptional LysR family regulator
MVLSSTAIRGHLRVNVDPTFARLVLVPGLGAFLEAYPDLHVELAIRDEIGDLIAEPEWVSPKSFSWEPRLC